MVEGGENVSRMRESVWVVSHTSWLRRRVAALLEREGYDVLMLDRAAGAVLAADSGEPLALVLEEYLPDASAYETLAELRRNPALQEVPVMIFSPDPATDGAAFRDRVLSAGAIPPPRLPVDPQDLASEIDGAIRFRADAAGSPSLRIAV
jgi:DNA-binding response OmpR family regulator